MIPGRMFRCWLPAAHLDDEPEQPRAHRDQDDAQAGKGVGEGVFFWESGVA